MDNTYYINTIRICIKAKKVTYGETLLFDIRSRRVKLVILAVDAGDASKKKIMDKCRFFHIPYLIMISKQDLACIFNKNISAFGISDEHLAKKFLENINKGGNDYGNKQELQ